MKVIILLLTGFSIIFASVGKITALKGEVYIKSDSKEVIARVGSLLESKDKVLTKDNSKALILFNDKTSITVGKNSTLEIEKFIYNENNNSENELNLKFGQGIFRTITGNIGKLNKERFKIKTSTASIGIRGTIFLVQVTNDALRVGVESGGVWIKPNGFDIPKDIAKGDVLTYDDVKKEFKVIPLKLWKEFNTEKKESEELIQMQNLRDDLKEQGLEIISEEEGATLTTLVESQTGMTSEVLKETISKLIEEVSEDAEDKVSEFLDLTEEQEEQIDDIVNEIVDNTEEVVEQISFDVTDLSDSIDDATMLLQPNAACNTYDFLQFGFVADNQTEIPYGIYITGTQTESSYIQSLIDDSQTSPVTYTGGASTFINGTPITDGSVSLTVDFASESFTGSVILNDSTWNATISSGTVTSTGFSSTAISGTTSDYGDITSGAIEGKFYGENAGYVGGKLQLNTDTTTAVGSFGASKY